MRPWFPETGPRGGRYRIEVRRCHDCGADYDAKVYPAKWRGDDAYRGSSVGYCPPCWRAKNNAYYAKYAGPGFKCCRGCGAKNTVENSLRYCDACLTTWRCQTCGDDRPEKRSRNWTRCMACDRRRYRHAKALPPREVKRFGVLFGALLSERCAKFHAAETNDAALAEFAEEVVLDAPDPSAAEAVARLRRGRGRRPGVIKMRRTFHHKRPWLRRRRTA